MRFNILCWAVLLGAFLISTPSVSYAETSIAVVDVQMLLGKSKAGKSLREKLKNQQRDFVDELAKKEKVLRKSEQDLIEEQPSLSKEEFAKKRKEFEEQLMKSRGEAQKKKSLIDKNGAKAMSKLQEEIVKAVQSVAGEKGYGLVLSRKDVVVADKTIDISEDTLKQLNKSVSDIALDKLPK